MSKTEASSGSVSALAKMWQEKEHSTDGKRILHLKNVPQKAAEEELVQVPNSVTECEKLFMQCWKESVPVKKKSQELLLQFIDQARERNRHPFETFVMLLGASGVGKSTTINKLLNAELAAASPIAAATRSVSEFSKSCNIQKLQLRGVRMNIIDTPGFGDTDGVFQDSCNLWAIKQFCNKYLKTAKILAYPNVILLCVKANDNRFAGKKSSFVKSLEILEAMRVIDKKNVNVVIVLVNACALGQNKETWSEKIMEKAESFKRVVKDKLGFLARVVYVENFPMDFSLKIRGAGSDLPDGTLQPENLYLAIMEQLEENGDEMGYSTFKQIFREGMEKQVFEPRRCVHAKFASENGNILDDHEELCLQILENVEVETDAFIALKAKFDKIEKENIEDNTLPEEHGELIDDVIQKSEERLAEVTSLETASQNEAKDREPSLSKETDANGESQPAIGVMVQKWEKQSCLSSTKTKPLESIAEKKIGKISEAMQDRINQIEKQMIITLNGKKCIDKDESKSSEGTFDRRETTKKTKWPKRLGKSLLKIGRGIAIAGLITMKPFVSLNKAFVEDDILTEVFQSAESHIGYANSAVRSSMDSS